MSVISLGYITINARDINEWRQFGTEVLGLMLNEASSNEQILYFRMDEQPSRLIIQQADKDKLAAAGWEFADQHAFEDVIADIEAAGLAVQRGDVEGAARRQVSDYAITCDVAGNPIELYYQRTGLVDDFRSPLAINSFVTGDMGMGHIVLPAPNMDETHDFYTKVMGFGNSDNLTMPGPGEGAPQMNIRFMHANNPRHHSLALFNFPVPTGIVHLILEVESIDEVGACLDRVNNAAYPLMATLGRHCNDNMLSFYVVGPGGIAIEYGCDGQRFDWNQAEPTISTVGDYWGHEYVPPPLDAQ